MSEPVTVLVVEDESIVAMDLRGELTSLGYSVVGVASTGEDAVEKARALRPSLVLMDIHLAGAMDGIEAAGAVRSLDIPVIFLTAYADRATIERAKLTQPFGYLIKPFDEQQLHTVMEMTLYRHRMERRLMESERWLSAVLSSIGDAVMATGADGRVAYVNRAAERLVGWTAGDLIGEEPPPGILGISGEGTLRDRAGEEIAVERTVTDIVDEDGRPLGKVTALRDIRERKRVETQLRTAKETAEAAHLALQRTSEMRNRFFASVSHELRTPLNAIIGFSEMMLALGPQEVPEDTLRSFLGHIHSSGHHLLELINDILDTARMESGRIDLHRQWLDVSTAVTQAAESLTHMASQAGVRLVVSEGSHGCAMVDPARFRQILYNLLANGIKFTPTGGEVRLELASDDDRVRIDVADTGPGISEEDQERIFLPFEQAGDLRLHRDGTGLGLYITRQLVEAHSGEITVRSTPGRGSRFSVSLPRGTRPHRAPAPAPSPTGGKARVLLIEDNAGAALLLRHALVEAGYEVRNAVEGLQGVAMAQAWQPHAVLLDIELPDVDGWEVLHLLKAEPDTREIPVVVVTVRDESEVGLALGAADYFVKPVDRGQLLACLGRFTLTTKVHERIVCVLAVDDDPVSLDLYRSLLVPEGFAFEGAGGGREGVRRAIELRPDMILLDLIMPDMDGFEVVRLLRADDRTREIPIVVVTGHKLTVEEKERLNGDILGVVEKADPELVGLKAWLRSAVPCAT